MKPYIIAFCLYNILLLLIIPAIALHADAFNPLADIARIVEGPVLHFSAIALVLSLFLILIGNRKVGLIAALCCVAAAAHALLLLQQPAVANIDQGHEMTVLSVNIEGKYGRDKQALFDNIIQTDADIVVILEADKKIRSLFASSLKYPHMLPCEKICDNVTYSKFPILSAKRKSLFHIWRSPRFAMMEIEIDKELKINVASVHMTKAWIPDSVWERKRLIKVLNKIEGPVIVAGDFNAAPWSHQLRQVAKGAHLRFNRLPPATWPSEAKDFGIPIDHVAVRGAAEIVSLKAWEGAPQSNHRGLLARIKVGKK